MTPAGAQNGKRPISTHLGHVLLFQGLSKWQLHTLREKGPVAPCSARPLPFNDGLISIRDSDEVLFNHFFRSVEVSTVIYSNTYVHVLIVDFDVTNAERKFQRAAPTVDGCRDLVGKVAAQSF